MSPVRCLVAVALVAAAVPAVACEASQALPAGRFQDNGDGTVTDTVSLLVWMRCPAGQRPQGNRCTGTARAVSLADAAKLVESTNHAPGAFHDDWRLPSLRELATITGRGCSVPRTDAALFPDTPARPFWSATTRAGEPGQHFAMDFGATGVAVAPESRRLHVRLVRTGP